ncbi:MAG: cytochrome c oxidase assembly factor Coa1 family protein [Planctomycetota bacterium]
MSDSNKGWFARNWIWAVPSGCLLPIVICAGLGVWAFSAGMGAIKGSDAYAGSLEAAKADPEVQAALGQPIEDGFPSQANYNITNGNETADLIFPISGPNGTATVYVNGTSTGGAWTYTKREVVLSDGTMIDLREGAAEDGGMDTIEGVDDADPAMDEGGDAADGASP